MKVFVLCALVITSQLSPGGNSGPLAGALTGPAAASYQPPGPVHPPLRREKRCSCSNMQDTECVYFCHVGIVWVNTPGQVVPYGLGNPLMRRKREVRRCLCAKGGDGACQSYCQTSANVPRHIGDAKVRMFRTGAGKRTPRATNDAAPGRVSWGVES